MKCTAATVALLSALSVRIHLSAAAGAKPHLVYVLVDDLGFNDNWDRSPDIVWPHMAKLAKEGIALETFYTQPLCTPSRASLMTGRWPARLGLQNGVIQQGVNYGLPLNETSLATKLNAVGYRSYGVGKWHLGCYNNRSSPQARGFHEFYGYWSGAEDYTTHEVAGMLDLHDNLIIDKTKSGEFSTWLFERKIEAIVKAHKANHSTDPMFLYYPMQNVHAPLSIPPTHNAFIETTCGKIQNADRQTYCKMAMIADVALGNLTTLLDATFAGEDLLMVVSGDNGGMPGAAGNNMPLRGHKAELWEGGIRNNCLVRSRTLIPAALAGTRYNGGLVHLVDWHASFAILGGAAANAAAFPLDGLDVFTAIIANKTSPRTEFLININQVANCQPPDMLGAGAGTDCPPEMAYRMGKYKYIASTGNDTYYPIPTGPDNTWEGITFQEIFSGKLQGEYPRRRLDETPVGPPPASCVTAFSKLCPGETGMRQTCRACFQTHMTALLEAGCVRPASAEALCEPGPESAITALFDIEADPTESKNLLSVTPVPAAIQAVVGAINAKLMALLAQAVPPGNLTMDGRSVAVAARDGGLNTWCPFDTEQECQATATPTAPDK